MPCATVDKTYIGRKSEIFQWQVLEIFGEVIFQDFLRYSSSASVSVSMIMHLSVTAYRLQ